MIKSITFTLALLGLVALASCRWAGEPSHEYSPSVSAEIAEAIKEKLYFFILTQIS